MQTFQITKLWNGKVFEKDRDQVDHTISMRIRPSSQSLELHVIAPYFGTSYIPDRPVGRCPRLYDHEVVEVFIASKMSKHQDPSIIPYFEIILGPHGHYLAISHTGQGNWSACNDSILLQNPAPSIHISADRKTWSAVVQIPYELLPEPQEDLQSNLSLNWMFNAYAIHGRDSDRVYMALNPVPGDVPNFHQLKHFVPLSLQDGDPHELLIDNMAPPDSIILGENLELPCLSRLNSQDLSVSASEQHSVDEDTTATNRPQINTYGEEHDIDSVTKVYAESGFGLQSHIINCYISPEYVYSDPLLSTVSVYDGSSTKSHMSTQSVESEMSQYASLSRVLKDTSSVIDGGSYNKQQSDVGMRAVIVESTMVINNENDRGSVLLNHPNLKFVNMSSPEYAFSGKSEEFIKQTISAQSSLRDPNSDLLTVNSSKRTICVDTCDQVETLDIAIARLFDANNKICRYIFEECPSYYDTVIDMNVLFELYLHSSERVLLANQVDRKFMMSSKARYLCLTSQPRIICLDASGRLTGSVSWSTHSQIVATQVDDQKFTVSHVCKSSSLASACEQLDTQALFSRKAVFNQKASMHRPPLVKSTSRQRGELRNTETAIASSRNTGMIEEVEPYVSTQYRFQDSVLGSLVWVRAIQDINSAWERTTMPSIVPHSET